MKASRALRLNRRHQGAIIEFREKSCPSRLTCVIADCSPSPPSPSAPLQGRGGLNLERSSSANARKIRNKEDPRLIQCGFCEDGVCATSGVVTCAFCVSRECTVTSFTHRTRSLFSFKRTNLSLNRIYVRRVSVSAKRLESSSDRRRVFYRP